MTRGTDVISINRRRFTGTVTVDVSAYVNSAGHLTEEGRRELVGGLYEARGLSVRLVVGDLRTTLGVTHAETLYDAYRCTSVEVCGTDPGTVADIVTWLRRHYLGPEGDE